MRVDFTAVWSDLGARVRSCDRDGATGWQCDNALPFGSWIPGSGLTVDPAGDLSAALASEFHLYFAWKP